MNRLRAVSSVFRFEWKRSFTLPRLMVWSVLAMFPPAIVGLIFIGPGTRTAVQFGMALLFLIPHVVCMLSLLLWVSPVIHAELEGKTWIYLAVRPFGKSATLFGKYGTAVCWSILAGVASITLCVFVSLAAGALYAHFKLWLVFAVLVVVASVAYGALFGLIGVLFPRRAMVACVTYAMFSEFIIPNLPAVTVFSQFTISYRIRNLLLKWMSWKPPLGEAWVSSASPVVHLICLAVFTVVLLVVAVVVLRNREYLTTEEA